jgi:tRNA pseudouridine38-40 synthase
MSDAGGALVGRHDFRLFCERPHEQPSTLVEVESLEVVPAGGLVLVRIVASHFLWKMVRRLVGTLVRVGWGEADRGAVERLLAGDAGAGSPAEWTAPPSGLFLERVLYPGDASLPPVLPVTPLSGETDAALESRLRERKRR